MVRANENAKVTTLAARIYHSSCVLGMRQVIDDHFCRSKDLFALPVTALEHLQDGMIGMGRIVALGNRFM